MNDLEISRQSERTPGSRREAAVRRCARAHEHILCQIEGAVLIPMGSIPTNLQKLDVDEDVICFCHHGMRSLDVANWLCSRGIESAKSMFGGIDRWSTGIDPGVHRY